MPPDARPLAEGVGACAGSAAGSVSQATAAHSATARGALRYCRKPALRDRKTCADEVTARSRAECFEPPRLGRCRRRCLPATGRDGGAQLTRVACQRPPCADCTPRLQANSGSNTCLRQDRGAPALNRTRRLTELWIQLVGHSPLARPALVLVVRAPPRRQPRTPGQIPRISYLFAPRGLLTNLRFLPVLFRPACAAATVPVGCWTPLL